MPSNLLSFLIFIPLIGLLLLLLPRLEKAYFKYIALLASLFQLFAAILLFAGFKAQEGLQYVEKYHWVSVNLGSFGSFSIDYFLGLDGLNVSLVLLAAIVLVAGVIASWNVSFREKGYFVLYLLLSSSIMGCFVALDFFLFYLFFEFMLLPMYFLIGIWGGPRKEYASIKFFLYTFFGSLFILVAIIGLYLSVIDPAMTAVKMGIISDEAQATAEVIRKVQTLLAEGKIAGKELVRSFNMMNMTQSENYIPGSILSATASWSFMHVDARALAFWALLIGFLIKLPSFPFHTWLPDAHVEASTPISVVLAGVLLKIGGYGILRTAFAIFPVESLDFSWFLGLLGTFSILYGALNALAMKDLKKLIAYSSVSHMGFVLLGIASHTSEGINGAVFMMFSHGILASLLFICSGVIYDRTHDRLIENYRGLASKMPKFTTVITLAFFASLGLPGFSGFISEILVLLGAYKAGITPEILSVWMVVAATFGIVLGAAYFLWTLQRMFFGRFVSRKFDPEVFSDLNPREMLLTVPFIAFTLVLGIFPGILLHKISPFLAEFVQTLSIH